MLHVEHSATHRELHNPAETLLLDQDPRRTIVGPVTHGMAEAIEQLLSMRPPGGLIRAFQQPAAEAGASQSPRNTWALHLQEHSWGPFNASDQRSLAGS
ncbi:MAG: hypothetical protein ACOYEP_05710 [Limnochordia bacterium]